MSTATSRSCRTALLLSSVVALLAGPTASRADDSALTLFESRIRPVLVERCEACHRSGGVAEGGLVLDHREGLRAGGRGGPIVVPGDPGASRILAILRHEIPGVEMPEGGDRLDDATLDAFAAWIAAGAPDPRDPPSTRGDLAPADFAERRALWSFQPLAHPEPPQARLDDWTGNPIDRFLLARLDAAGLEPAPPATPAALLRRLSFVLTGLPPTPEEVAAFAADHSAAAYEATVDRLLASPRFGERFARHWMDLVRYCESHGSQGDPELPDAWRYRDYLIRAFNADLPYDRFVREQIAGDLLPDPRWDEESGTNESAIGPAHLRMVELGFVPVDALDDQVKVVENQIDVHSKTFFALTAACARCHDHKFDAITQEDFTALYGIFSSGRPGHVILERPDAIASNTAELAALHDGIRDRLADAWHEAAAGFADRLERQEARRRQATRLQRIVGEVRKAIDAIETPARRLALERRPGAASPAPLPVPISRWSFDGDASDSIGDHHGELLGGATVRDGRLVLDGVGANVRTRALTRELGAKTLEAWVTLANLDQRGGGVLGIDVPEGRFFDSIVFGEIAPRHWLAGSDFFNRTQDPQGAAETAAGILVHVVVTYAADGTISLFRDGVPYGTSYAKAPLRTFAAGGSRFLFGQRLSDINPPLAGEIDEARAYDRALSAEEVAASFQAGPRWVGDDELLAALPPDRRLELEDLRGRRERLLADLRAMAPAESDPLDAAISAAQSDPANPLHAWVRLSGTDEGAWPAAWQELATAIDAERRARVEANGRATLLWDLRTAEAGWFHHGTGPAAATAEGTFFIQPDGDRVVNGLLSAGIHSNRLSGRHAAVLQSPRFVIDSDSVHLRVHGRASVARLVIENYPIGNGGIYPAVRPERDEMGWIRLDTNYRRGATAYVELATDPVERASFGIGEVRKGDAPEPLRDTSLAAAPLLVGPPPRSAGELAARMADRLVEAVEAWRVGPVDEDQRALLDFFIRRDLLPTTLAALPSLREPVERYRSLERQIPVPRRAPGMLEGEGRDAPLFVRGQHLRPAATVPRRGLSLFGSEPFAPRASESGAPSGRLQLADEATGPARDLLARVMVNRLWHHVFGRGIVATTDNFGRLGTLPSHPDLLDWLAGRFIAEGWSVKGMLRRMVTSRAFQGAAVTSASAARIDPRNELVSHAPLRRLDAESIRDAILGASGQLDTAMGGPGVDVHYTGKTEGGGPVGPLDGNRRRSVYQRIRRNAHNPFLEVFDAPKPTTTRGARDVTGAPVQALTMLNSPFVLDQAGKWGAGVAAAPGPDERRLGEMIVRALSRPPDGEEVALLLAHLAEARAAEAIAPDGTARPPSDVEARAWGDVAHAILCLKEFTHVE